MKAIVPIAVTGAILSSSTVPETDYPAYNGGTTYALSARTISTATHRIYESTIVGNVGHDPTAGASQWLDVGPTNRWAMFDKAAGAPTTYAGTITVVLALPDAADSIGFVDLQAASIRVQLVAGATTLLDQTRAAPQTCEAFLSLPAGTGRTLTVTIAPTGGTAIVGKMGVGTLLDLGDTEDGPTVSILDYSKRETDAFGVTTVVERSWAKRTALRSRLDSSLVDDTERRLAAVRAVPLIFIGHDAYPALTSYGFIKEFTGEVQIGATSFYSLTFEGLPSATLTVPATDPAIGQASNLLAVRPITINDGVLTSSTVPEADHPAWVNTTTYALAARVIKASTHRIYESLTAANVGHDPATDATNWLDAGPTNRWAMFDQALGTVTAKASGFSVVLTSASVTRALAVLDAAGASVRVQATGYDQTKTLPSGDSGTAMFLDLNVAAGVAITVTIASVGGAVASVGTLLMGSIEPFGITENSPTIGITDFSVKTADDFGNTTPVERAWSKRMALRSLIQTSTADNVLRRIATLRAIPTLWVAYDQFSSLAVYGFFRDFSLSLSAQASTCGLTIEGLAKASAVADVPTIGWDTLSDVPANIAALTGTESINNANQQYNQINGLPAAIDPVNMAGSGRIAADQVQYSGGPLVQALQPAEAGSNVTGTHTAASITGQAATATSSDYAVITGTTRPSDNAGTSGLLTAIGSYTSIIGNSTAKLGGTHGAFEGGAVGSAMSSTAFISTSILNVASGGSWQTWIALDDDATTYSTSAAMNYAARWQGTGAGAGIVQLFAAGTQIGTNTNVTGATTASRMRLIYDGNKVWIEIDGTVIGTKATASANQRLWPKVLHLFDGNNLAANLRYMVDILYGPYSDNSWGSTSGSPNAPADNADVTATHTAASIAGQGAFATQNTAAFGGSLLTGFGSLAGRASIRLGDSFIYRNDGTTSLTDAIAVTSLGTAASITGQGAFATQSSVGYGTSYLTGFGGLAPLSSVTLGTNVRRADGITAVTDATAITSLGTAASITGQGAFATVNTAAYGGTLLTGFGGLAPLSTVTLGTNVVRADGTTAVTDASAITSLGTASAIAGQADWATFTGINTAGMTGRVTNLNSSGNLASLTNVVSRRINLLKRADDTTAIADADVVTSLGTAASITGQGSFATVSSAAYGSSLLTGFGTLAPLSNVTLGTNVRRADGVTSVTDATAITSLGTAASITGQGAFATVSTAAYGSGLLTGFGALAARAKMSLGDGFTFRADGTTSLTDAIAVTSLGTASAITGQGALATASTAAWGSQISGRPTELTDGRVSTALTSAGLVQTRVPSTLLGNASASNIESDPYFVDTAAWSLWGLQTTFSTTAAALAALGTAKVIKAAIGSSNPLGFDGPLRDVPPNGTFFGAIKIYVEAGFIGQPQFAVKFYDRAGTFLDQTYITFGTFASVAAAAAGAYDVVTPAKAAPAGTVKIAVGGYCGNVAGAAMYLGLPVIGQVITPGQAGLGDTTNFVPDPDFVDAASTWGGVPPGWAVVANATAGEGAGTNKVRFTASMGGTMITKLIACPPNKSLITSVYVKVVSGTTSGGVIVSPMFYDAAGAFLSYGTNFTAYLDGSIGTGRYQIPTKSPANTASMKFAILNYAATGNRVFEVSEPLVRFATVLGDNAMRADGVTVTTETAAITSLGTAAAISGQGAFATVNTAAFGGALLTGFGNMAGRANVRLGDGYVFRNDGTTSLTDALAVTSLGTASSITGQAATATDSSYTAVTGTKPPTNADNTAASVPMLLYSASSITFEATYAGVLLAGEISKTVAFSRLVGTTDVSPTATWGATPTSGITCSISSSGLLSFTAVANGSVYVTAAYGGTTLTFTLPVDKHLGPTPTGSGSGSTSASASAATSINSASYGGAATSVMTVRAGSAGQIDLTAPLYFDIYAPGTRAAYGKWQWRVVGGTFADVTTEIGSAYSAYYPSGHVVGQDPSSGYIEVTMSKTGLTNGTDYEFQLLLRNAVATPMIYFNGTATAIQH
jgi:hypothetical protein